jgi:hypothetical protein
MFSTIALTSVVFFAQKIRITNLMREKMVWRFAPLDRELRFEALGLTRKLP